MKKIDLYCKYCHKQLWQNNKTDCCRTCFNKHYKTIVSDQFCIDCHKKLNKYKKALRCHSCNRKHITKKTQCMVGKNNPNYKNSKTEVTCDYCKKLFIKYKSVIKNHNFCNKSCMGKWLSINNSGKKNGNYIHGQANLPYSSEWTNKLKSTIRKRDNYTCQNCGVTEEEHLTVRGRVLDVHHIDYIKENCSEDNLITLCMLCNIKANTNRDSWIPYYRNKLCFQL